MSQPYLRILADHVYPFVTTVYPSPDGWITHRVKKLKWIHFLGGCGGQDVQESAANVLSYHVSMAQYPPPVLAKCT